MKSLWDERIAAQCRDDLDLRVYSSQLLGQEPQLVLHGGGNTSVKTDTTNIFGNAQEILYIKGSGWDLQTIKRAGFAPVQLEPVQRLAELPQLSDSDMVNALKTRMTLADAPSPSVETILHAIIPRKFVDHTHANAIVSITNTPNGAQRIRDIYGDSVIIVPYVMPGFDLARLCKQILDKEYQPQIHGMVLLNHGIFSFADNAEASYERMISLVSQAEDYLARQGASILMPPLATHVEQPKQQAVLAQARLRAELSRQRKQPLLLKHYHSDLITQFCTHEQLERISQQGPATPDHVIRTKRLPLLTSLQQDKDFHQLNQYTQEYNGYFNQYKKSGHIMLDPLPRVVLDAQSGLYCVANNTNDADIIADIYQHTMRIILAADVLEQYQALSAEEIFAVEYWELEQAKLKKTKNNKKFAGEIALVTGAASGIGKACVAQLLAQGACVIGLDINPQIIDIFDNPSFLGICCDITHQDAVQAAVWEGVDCFGGLDMLVLNAGVFPKACLLKDMQMDYWREVMQINLDANILLLKIVYPFLALAPRQGRVAIIGSKNVPAPGPGAAAYSSSKAALNQLMRVLALEWAQDGIRLNSVHPNAVFDTGIWTDEVLQSRAKQYQMSVEEYKSNNLLKTEVTSRHVANMVIAMLDETFARTTAAQVPIDGGNERVI